MPHCLLTLLTRSSSTDSPPAIIPDSTSVPTGRVAIWWFLALGIAIFGGLITCYIMSRLVHAGVGAEAHHTVQWAGALNTLVLLTSSLAAVLAHDKAHRGDGPGAAERLDVLDAARRSRLPLRQGVRVHPRNQRGLRLPFKSTFWGFYFLMTGLHGLHVIGGMTAIFVVAQGAKVNKHLQRVEYAGMYWHLVDVVWIFLFPLVSRVEGGHLEMNAAVATEAKLESHTKHYVGIWAWLVLAWWSLLASVR